MLQTTPKKFHVQRKNPARVEYKVEFRQPKSVPKCLSQKAHFDTSFSTVTVWRLNDPMKLVLTIEAAQPHRPTGQMFNHVYDLRSLSKVIPSRPSLCCRTIDLGRFRSRRNLTTFGKFLTFIDEFSTKLSVFKSIHSCVSCFAQLVFHGREVGFSFFQRFSSLCFVSRKKHASTVGQLVIPCIEVFGPNRTAEHDPPPPIQGGGRASETHLDQNLQSQRPC